MIKVVGQGVRLFLHMYVDHITTICQPSASGLNMPAVILLKEKKVFQSVQLAL